MEAPPPAGKEDAVSGMKHLAELADRGRAALNEGDTEK